MQLQSINNWQQTDLCLLCPRVQTFTFLCISHISQSSLSQARDFAIPVDKGFVGTYSIYACYLGKLLVDLYHSPKGPIDNSF